MKKRLLASLLCLCLVVGLLPTTALAVEPEETPAHVTENGIDNAALSADAGMSGNCGAEGDEGSVTWALTENEDGEDTYTLTISGEGAMADYAKTSAQ